MAPMGSFGEGLRENVSDILRRFDLVDPDGSILDLFADEVMADIDVFGPLVEDVVI